MFDNQVNYYEAGGFPEGSLKEIKSQGSQQGEDGTSREEGGLDREPVKGTSPPLPGFMACGEVLRTWGADSGEAHPEGSPAHSGQDKDPRVAGF